VTWTVLARAARHRIHAVRTEDNAGSGFMLIYVLMITTIVTILVGSTLVITAGSIVPSVRSAYSQAADAAAQGGVQSFVAYADKYCIDASSSVAACTLPTNFGSATIFTKDGYTAGYTWHALKDPSNRYFRVRATGTVTQGSSTVSKTVVADVAGGASTDVLDYGVVTGFESQSSATVLSLFPRRTIALDAGAIDAADVPIKGNDITWAGASPGVAAGKVAVCNATFEAKGGRSNNPPPKAPNPYVDWTESGVGGNNYTNFQPCQTSWGTLTKLLAPTNPADGVGGYYSNDALLLSNSYPGGTGPLFNQPVTTGWQYTQSDAGLCGTVPGQNYRSFNLSCAGYPLEVGGSPAPTSTYGSVQYAPTGPAVPTASPVIVATACVYSGPTRVQLKVDPTLGDIAVVTSPQTTLNWVNANASTRPPQCYVGASTNGMAQQTVSLSGINVLSVNNDGSVPPTTPATAHGSSGWPVTGQKLGTPASAANTVFYRASGALPTALDPVSSAASDTCSAASLYTDSAAAPCAWTNVGTATDGNGAGTAGWKAYTSGTNCASTLADTDRLTFECDFNAGILASPHDNYGLVRDRLKIDLARSTCLTGTVAAQQSCLQTLLNTELNPANTSTHRYLVTATSPVTTSLDKTLSSNAAPLSSDPFFDSTTTPGIPTVERLNTTTFTFTITRQVNKCYGVVVLGVCLLNLGGPVLGNQWGSDTTVGTSTPQFRTTITNRTASILTAGSIGASYFPSMSDVTQYALGNSGANGTSGPGDLYIEGTAGHTMAVVAANDVIVTGNVAPAQLTQALQVIGRDNVRVYHPVKCKITDSTAIGGTDPGFCPNDISGLYSSVLPAGARPDQQYVNLRPDLGDATTPTNSLKINAAVFALGNADGSVTCPQPPNGGGVCGGEFTVDNYNRGAALGALNQTGTLAMAHHAPVGQEWEVADSAGATSRPYSGYQLWQRYQNLKQAIASTPEVSGLLHTTSSTSSLWHVVSVSAGAGS
jgi:hypothetical protein